MTYHRGIHRFAQFLTVWTFLVVCLGGTVKSKEAGLVIAEPFLLHWVHGWWRAPNYAFEYGHRMLVGLLGCGVLALMIWILLKESRSAVRRLAVWAFVTVVIQGVFGYLTVAYFTHWPTAVPHAALGQTFLCILACLAAVNSPVWLAGPSRNPTPNLLPAGEEGARGEVSRLATYVAIALFVQTVLGAIVRHDDKGEMLRNGQENTFLLLLTLHLLGAAVAVYLGGWLVLRIFLRHRGEPALVRPASVLAVLLGVQLFLGSLAAVLKVLLSQTFEAANDPPALRALIATAHMATGAAALAVSVVLAARAYRFTMVER